MVLERLQYALLPITVVVLSLFLTGSKLVFQDGYLWIGNYEGKPGDVFTAVKQDNFNNVIALGNTKAIKYRKSNLIFKSFTNKGELVGEYVYGGVDNEFGFDFELVGNSKVIVGSTGSKVLNPWITQIDENYEMTWELILDRDQGEFLGLEEYDEGYAAFGNIGGAPLLCLVDANGEVQKKITLSKSGNLIDVVVKDSVIYCLVNNCTDCYKSRSPEVTLHMYKEGETTLVKTFKNKDIQIGRSLLDYEENLFVAGELFVPKEGIQGVVLDYSIEQNSVIKSNVFGEDWDEETSGAAFDINDNIIVYGRSLSDAESRKKMETYTGWSITLDQSLETIDEFFFGDQSYHSFESYLSDFDGSDIYVGAIGDQPGILNRQLKVKQSTETGQQRLDIEVRTKDIALDVNDVKSLLKFKIANTTNTIQKNIKLDLSVSGDLQLVLPQNYIIEEVLPNSDVEVEVPFSTVDAGSLQSTTITLQSERLNNAAESIIAINEVKSVELVSELIPSRLDLDTSDLRIIVSFSVKLSNQGNAALENGSLRLVGSNGVEVAQQEQSISLSPNEEREYTIPVSISQDALFPHTYIAAQVRNADGFILENNTLTPLNQADIARLKEEIANTVFLQNEAKKKEKIEDIAMLSPAKVDAFETKREVVKISSDKLEKIETSNAYTKLGKMDVDWNYSIGRINKAENPRQRIMLTIEGYDEVVDSVSVLINGTRKSLDMESADIVTEGDKLVLIFEWHEILLEGNTEIRSVLHIKGDDFTKGEPIFFDYKEKKHNLYIVSIGVPDQFSDESTRLKYTSKDAKELSEFFAGNGVVDDFEQIHSFVLSTPEQTTKSKILEAFTEIEIMDPGPDDLLICYFSTHAFPDEDDLYIAPSDYNFKATYSSAINFTSFINEYLRRRVCRKVLLLDVCHSGAVLGAKDGEDELDKTDQIDDYMVATLNRISNLYFISSSKAGEYSYEIESLGNSAFMAAIKNMRDPFNSDLCRETANAIDKDKDRIVNFTEMTSYLQKTVPCIVEKERGAEQNPKASRMGNDDFKIFDLN